MSRRNRRCTRKNDPEQDPGTAYGGPGLNPNSENLLLVLPEI
jgi:hypothetical protein